MHLSPSPYRTVGIAFTVLSVLLLSACASSPHSYTEGAGYTASNPPIARVLPAGIADADDLLHPAYLQELFAQARSMVEQHQQTSLQEITLRIASNKDLEKEVTRETRSLVYPQFSNRRFAEHFLSRLMQDQTGTYAALYTNLNKQVIVNLDLLEFFLNSIDGPVELARQALLALLIHENVHASDDVRFQIHRNRRLSFKDSFSQSATYEGHAQMVSREICQLHQCQDGLVMLDAFMFDAPRSDDPLARNSQAVSRSLLEYSYIEGERFMRGLKSRPDGKQLIESVLRAPPDDPVQILAPENYPDVNRSRRNERLRASIAGIDHPWARAPWATVETSPIKGLDIRDNPQRRAATLEGFTRLITSMVGVQIYNQSTFSNYPVDITLLQTNSTITAEQFAHSFHNRPDATPVIRHRRGANGSARQRGFAVLGFVAANEARLQLPEMKILLSHSPVTNNNAGNRNYVTLVAYACNYVIQIGALGDRIEPTMFDFAERVIDTLLLQER